MTDNYDMGVAPSGSGWSGKPQAGSSLGHTATIPNALVRLSYETGCLSDRDEFGYAGASVGDIRALMALAHNMFDWRPINTAPTDGSIFIVFTEEGRTYDFAEYDTRHEEFVKHGCGWDCATHWATIEAHALKWILVNHHSFEAGSCRAQFASSEKPFRGFPQIEDGERKQVVAWLRMMSRQRDDRADPEWAAALSEAADRIEQGAHTRHPLAEMVALDEEMGLYDED